MSYQKLQYSPEKSPDLSAVKFKLGSMRGIVSMDIESKSNLLNVAYDDTYVNEKQITECMNELGYTK